jgi:hypothetical protein
MNKNLTNGQAAQLIADKIKFFSAHNAYDSFDQALKELKSGSTVIYTHICKKTNEFEKDLDSWKTLKLDFTLNALLTSDLIFITIRKYVEININEVFEMLKLGKYNEVFIPTNDVAIYGWNRLENANLGVFDQTRTELTKFFKVVN